MILSHRIALDPTFKQRNYFVRAAGTSRFTWNWTLDFWNKAYQSGLKPNASAIKRLWNEVKGRDFPWVKEVHKDANQQVFTNLQAAFSKFFKKTAKHPTFKKRGQHDSFYISNDKLKVEGKRVRVPVLGWVKMREAIRFEGRIMSATVSRTAQRWFISFQVDLGNFRKQRKADGVVGIDLGLKFFATLSTGEHIETPKPLFKQLHRLRLTSKAHSRKVKGSANRRKSTERLAWIHARVSNIRNDFLHRLSTRMVSENQVIVLEDLNVKGMVRNHCLARAISDAGWAEFGRQVVYKVIIYDSSLILADQWFPSSKKCNVCGHVKKSLMLSERVFRCENCGNEIDRDENASLNLRNLSTVGLTGTPSGRKKKPVDRNGQDDRDEAGTKPCSLVGTN